MTLALSTRDSQSRPAHINPGHSALRLLWGIASAKDPGPTAGPTAGPTTGLQAGPSGPYSLVFVTVSPPRTA